MQATPQPTELLLIVRTVAALLAARLGGDLTAAHCKAGALRSSGTLEHNRRSTVFVHADGAGEWDMF
jgi:hypothetical protein